MHRVSLVALLAAMAPFAQAAPCPDDVVLRFNEAALQAVKAAKTPPPRVARYLAIMHLAIYDTLNGFDRTRSFYGTAVVAPPGAPPEVAAAVAAHRVLTAFYPRQTDCVDAALDAALAGCPDSVGKTAAMRFGQSVAEGILAMRATDGASRRYVYSPGTDPGFWRPTLPEFKPGLLPQWGFVKPFAGDQVKQITPPGPPALGSKEYVASYLQVKTLGAVNSTVRTPEQTQIARFWADGEGTVTPPGHWNRIAQTVSRERRLCLADNARLFALLNVALADAGTLCWECKYRFSYWRPIQAIREADRTGDPATPADPCWTPLLPTPPFPSYSSGHSTFSSAAATVLANFFGDDQVRFTSSSDSLPCVCRSFTGFWAAAQEAGWSRIYGGIHYDFDNAEGLRCGRALGDLVSRTMLQPIQQTSRRDFPTPFATRRRWLAPAQD